MLVREDGLFEGSISAGCLEGAVIVTAQDVAASGVTTRIDFEPDDSLIWGTPSLCGGRVSVLVQPGTEENLAVDPAGRLIRLSDGSSFATGQSEPFDEAAAAKLATLAALRRPGLVSADYFFQIVSPLPRMLIIGGNHIAQRLAELACVLEYGVVVVDPRRAFANSDRFPHAAISNLWPDEFLATFPADRQTALVTLSHDTKIDDLALKEALASPAFFIGALGSRRTHAARIDRLGKTGISPASLARIEGPAGIDMNAAGPAEIALSILAGIVAAWRRDNPAR